MKWGRAPQEMQETRPWFRQQGGKAEGCCQADHGAQGEGRAEGEATAQAKGSDRASRESERGDCEGPRVSVTQCQCGNDGVVRRFAWEGHMPGSFGWPALAEHEVPVS